MRRLPTVFLEGFWQPVLILGCAIVAWSSSPLLAQPADGTYAGSTAQGRSFSLVVTGGQVASTNLNYLCPYFTSTVTLNWGSCPITNNSFTCGSAPPPICSPYLSSHQVSGTFQGNAVSGSINVKVQPGTSSFLCCTLTAMSWNAVRSCSGIGDSDGDGYCDDVDVCPGFDDGADADADGVPDGCDICPGFDDGTDTDADGVPDGCDPDLDLYGLIVDTVEVYEACRSITATYFDVRLPWGDVTFRAGEYVILGEDFVVQAGCSFTLELQTPSGCP